MKWFKHETDADKSEGVDALMSAEGFAGYGRWNRLLEIIAFKMGKTDRCHAEYSISKWCSLLGLKQKKLKTFLELTENKLKTKVVYCENIIRIEIPNLLNKRDNYTKDLEVASKKLTSIDIDIDIDIDKEEEEERIIKENITVSNESRPSPLNARPKQPKKKLTDEEWLESLKSNPAYTGIDIAVLQGKLIAWCELKGKEPTRARLLNWLNREERPMKAIKNSVNRENLQRELKSLYDSRKRKTDMAECLNEGDIRGEKLKADIQTITVNIAKIERKLL